MVESSESSNSSSDDAKRAENSKKNRTSSGSDFEPQPTLISPGGAPTISKQSSASKTNTSMNPNVLAAMAKGTSKDFLTKMNAAMQRNISQKLQLPMKLKKIGFDNDQCSSSKKKLKKYQQNKTKISSDTENQSKIGKLANKSESDSDSDDESKAKRIEEIKKELKNLKMSRKRRKSSSDDSSSSEEDKSNVSEVISSFKSAKIDQNSSKITKSDSDDSKMTSIMTQRENSGNKSVSENSSDADSVKNSSNTQKSLKNTSEIENNELFSQFLNENIDFKETKIKSSFDPMLLHKDDEIFTCHIPKHIPPELLRHLEFALDKLSTINLAGDKYYIKTQLFPNKKRSHCLINRHKNTHLANVDLSGHINVFKTCEKITIDKRINLTADEQIVCPKLKQRHPIFGAELCKVVLNEGVQKRLDAMIGDLNRRIGKSKKKNKLSGEDVFVVKEDIYEMLSLLSKSETIESRVETKLKRKTKKTSDKNEPALKKSKVKLNSAKELKSGDVLLGVDEQKDVKINKKTKMLNSTFASPSISSTKIFETNESISIIHPEPSKSLKHLHKIIKKVARGNDFVADIHNTSVNNLEQTEIVVKKKKKKNKNKSDEI